MRNSNDIIKINIKDVFMNYLFALSIVGELITIFISKDPRKIYVN